MVDPAIQDFFQKRKDDWLKKNLKPSMTEEEIQNQKEKCEKTFALANWLTDAANRIGSRAMTTHPSKFSHPSTGVGKKNKKEKTYVTPIIANCTFIPDGFLKTGNAHGKTDSVGDAGALDVEKFLNLKMQDHKTLLTHIIEDTKLSKNLLSIESDTYENIRKKILALVQPGEKISTNSKIKQVYFPVEDNYHLLSILNNSGLIFELRKRMDSLRFSEEQKNLRDKMRKGEYSEQSYSEIYNLTTIGYGGTKPQNISVLNNQNGGKANLFLSIPPHLDKRSVYFPRKNFFSNSIWYHDIREPLRKLHGIFKTGLNSEIPRRNLESGREHHIEEILDIIIERAAVLRSVVEDQYREDNSALPEYQKIWLCNGFEQTRKEQDDWLVTLCAELAKWIASAYAKVIKKSVMLGPVERDYLKTFINLNREALR